MDFNNFQDKVIILLALCFFGTYGGHNFVMGEWKKAIVKIAGLLLTPFGALTIVLNIMDLIKICNGTYTIDTEAFI